MEAVQELREAVNLYKQSRGKTPKGVTEAQKRRWSERVAALLSDADLKIDTHLADLASLPPSVVANAAVEAWPSMNKDRRAVYLRWLGTLDADRAIGHKALLIPGLLESAPEVSANLLCGLALNKEARERLGPTLISGATAKLGLFFENDPPRYRVPDMMGRLLDLAEGPKVGVGERWRTIKLVLEQIAKDNLHQDASAEPVLRRLDLQIKGMPLPIKAEVKAVLAQLGTAILVERFFPTTEEKERQTTSGGSAEGSARAHEPDARGAGDHYASAPEKARERDEQLPPLVRSEASVLMQRLSDWINSLREQAETLANVRAFLGKLDTAQGSSQISTAKFENLLREVENAQNSAKAAEARAQSLQVQLEASIERESSTQRILAEREMNFRAEREQLFGRVESNADRRLEEFRNGLASSFQQLLNGVPQRGSPVSGKTADVLLARLYQLVDLLESKGIRVTSSSGGNGP